MFRPSNSSLWMKFDSDAKPISTLSPNKSSRISPKSQLGIKFIVPGPKEVLSIYQIFMENSFNLLPKRNLLASFMKRKIKIFKNFKNQNFNANYLSTLGRLFLKSSDSMNLFRLTYRLQQIELKKLKQGSKVKRFQWNAQKIVFVTNRI